MTKCYFCKFSVKPDFTDVETLKKFLTPRGKILGKEKSNVCAKHQRFLTKQIKYARYLALLPYTSYQAEKMK